MNKLLEIKNRFDRGLIDKDSYIDEMYRMHSSFFEYSEYLGVTNISKIVVENERVIVTFRESDLQFICTKGDKRLAPFDTINFGDYEKDELITQLKLISDEDTILDIGGNLGWYAMHVGKYRPNSTVLTFEPIPATFLHLNENIQLNGLKNITSYNFAFSDAEGTFDFYFDPALSVNASLSNVSNNDRVKKVVCSVKKLDDFVMTQALNVNFIKCDVEGAELLVFKGGRELLKRDTPVVYAEMLRKWARKFNYHPNDMILFFKELGYSCFVQHEQMLYPCLEVDDNTVETNYFFLHADKHREKLSEFRGL